MMRESIGTTFNLTLLFIFILLVSGFALFGVNYYRAFSVKNSILSYLEAYRGNTSNVKFQNKVNDTIERLGYNISQDRMTSYINSNSKNKWNCVDTGWCYYKNGSRIRVLTFVNTDIPIINRVLSRTNSNIFVVSGETKTIK